MELLKGRAMVLQYLDQLVIPKFVDTCGLAAQETAECSSRREGIKSRLISPRMMAITAVPIFLGTDDERMIT